jgi:hypothetical protein
VIPRLRLAGCLLGVLLLCAGAGAAESYDNAALGYFFTLPPGWVQIPDEIIAQASATATKLANQPIRYEAGFQRQANRWLAYPYLLIQQHVGTDASSEQIAQAASDPHGFDKAKEALAKTGLLQGGGFGQPTVDSRRRYVFVPLSMTLQGVGELRGTMAFRPAKDGLLQLNFYAPATEYEDDRLEFDTILDSLHFRPGRDYVAHNFFGNLRLTPILLFAAGGALVGLLIGIARRSG